MPRWVLLYHDCPPGYDRPSHWDLMLEAGDALETWALFELPRGWEAVHATTRSRHPDCAPLALSSEINAERLESHRLAYLSHQGAISGGRGEVARVAAGTFRSKRRSEDTWLVVVEGGALGGKFVLTRELPASGAWRLKSEGAGHSGPA